jgi:hypothetical protein
MVIFTNIVIVSSNFGLFNRFKIINQIPKATELDETASRKDSNAKILIEEESVRV